MEQPIIDPVKVPYLIAGGLGVFLSALFQRKTDKVTILTTLASGEIVVFYFAQPLWSVLHARFTWVDEQWQGPIALTIGLLAIFVLGGVIKMFSDFMAAPMKTIGDFIVTILDRVIPGRKGG